MSHIRPNVEAATSAPKPKFEHLLGSNVPSCPLCVSLPLVPATACAFPPIVSHRSREHQNRTGRHRYHHHHHRRIIIVIISSVVRESAVPATCRRPAHRRCGWNCRHLHCRCRRGPATSSSLGLHQTVAVGVHRVVDGFDILYASCARSFPASFFVMTLTSYYTCTSLFPSMSLRSTSSVRVRAEVRHPVRTTLNGTGILAGRTATSENGIVVGDKVIVLFGGHCHHPLPTLESSPFPSSPSTSSSTTLKMISRLFIIHRCSRELCLELISFSFVFLAVRRDQHSRRNRRC